ncbi:DSE1 [Candida pseudojiufengensis]|uniref:DSE1 n=1 Tax=Candida pseudojiufengensis TaxID=497109 RepID=UPI002225B4BD|nr:DSE1 [Candida pseudojiufengensis]KAI5965232.1 DSE1 [Candida pseudojiufengensis]
MTEYYEPTLIFRQNAIRRFNPQLSPISSVESLLTQNNDTLNNDSIYSQSSINSPYMNKKQNLSSSSWLLNNNNPKDTEILNKSCSLNRTNIKSNYWKIPDNDMNLTSISIKNQSDNGNPIIAISSGNQENNLFIYELNINSNHLIHHSTISLSNIYNTKWINNDKNHLITGNNKGYAHLVSIPNLNEGAYDDDDELYSAEICKRFNHRKHIKDKSKIKNNSPITKLNLFNNDLEMISIYDNYLFHWDIKNSESQKRPQPISISNIQGISNFDNLKNNNTTISICGKFGISLFDTRFSKLNIPMSSSNNNNFRQLSANIVKWNPDNDNILAVAHGDGIVRLWDIRKQDYFTTINSESSTTATSSSSNSITSIEWNQGDLFTGGQNGNIIHWDLTSDINITEAGHLNCGLSEGFNSIKFNDLKTLDIDVNQRQCGTILPASNTDVVSMCSITNDLNNEVKLLSIDGSSFLGVHSKIKESIKLNINSDKLYYTEEDIQNLLINESYKNDNKSNNSIMNDVSQESLIIEPLSISRKPTCITIKSTDSIIDSVTSNGIDLINESSTSESETEVESDNDLLKEENLKLCAFDSPPLVSTIPTNSPKFNQSINQEIEDITNLNISTNIQQPPLENEEDEEFNFNFINNNSNSDISSNNTSQSDNEHEFSPIRNNKVTTTDSKNSKILKKSISLNSLSTIATDIDEMIAHESINNKQNEFKFEKKDKNLIDCKYNDIFKSLDDLNLFN